MIDMRRKNRSRTRGNHSYHSLEARRLLAGDIQVVDDGTILTLVGDQLANEVSVTQNENGQLVIAGVNTTINGSTEPLVASGSQSYLTLVMNDGDDIVNVTNVGLRSQIAFHGGNGNDQLALNEIDTLQLHVKGDAGNDLVQLSGNVRRSSYVYLGAGDDILAVESFRSGRNFKVFGGNGDDTFVSALVQVRRKFEVHLENGNDRLVMTGDSSAGRKARLELGDGNDFVSLRPTQTGTGLTFNRSTVVNLGEGADVGDLGSSLNLRRRVRIDGGPGVDGLSNRGNVYATRNFETSATGVQARIDQVFADLEAAGVDSQVYSGISSVEPIDLTIDTTITPLNYTENDSPISIDDALTISGDVDATINGATVAVDGFVSGQDVLTFTDTSAIAGSFDATTGTMTLMGDAPVGDYETALRQVLFSNTAVPPNTSARTIQIGLLVGDESFTASRPLVVNVLGNGPVLTASLTSTPVTPQQLSVAVDPQIEVTDPDDDTFNSATVSIQTGFVSGEDLLEVNIPNTSNVLSAFDDSTGVLTLTGTATVAEYQSILRSINYNNSNQEPTLGSRLVRFSISDGVTTGSADVEIVLNAVSIN